MRQVWAHVDIACAGPGPVPPVPDGEVEWKALMQRDGAAEMSAACDAFERATGERL